MPPNEKPEQRIARERVLHRERDLEEEAQELAAHFNSRFIDSLLRCIRNSLDAIKRRVFSAYVSLIIFSFT